MDLTDSLKLERYRFVIDRQRYFTDLARDAFALYSKLFSAIVAAGVALVSSGNKLELRPEVLSYLVHALVYLAAFLAIVASAQIVFCLGRWRGFRRAERSINPESPRIGRWWWVFEGLYIVAIWAGVLGTWLLSRQIPQLLSQISPAAGGAGTPPK
jgi:hypothetical protein